MAEAPSPTGQPPYAGDLTATQAWKILADNDRARLVDVRTDAEWAYVGVPDLSPLGRQAVLLSWQTYPTMQRNESFARQIEAQGPGPDDPLVFLCRSGVRSRAAAQLMTAQGYRACYNIADGFEGPPDDSRHRGSRAGWKAEGLPWIQG
jgi:rhodanese-related sulfurtransferase